MKADGYQPIDCAVHDVLEASAVRGTMCKIRFRDGSEEREVLTTIVDVYVRDGAEWADLGDGYTVRLDRLVEVTPT